MGEVKSRIGHARKQLRITVRHIPNTDVSHTWKEFMVLGDRIISRANINSISNKVSCCESHVVHAADYRFTGFVHLVPDQRD